MSKCKIEIRPFFVILSIALVLLSCRKYEERKLISWTHGWETQTRTIELLPSPPHDGESTGEKPFNYLYFEFSKDGKVIVTGNFKKSQTYHGYDFFTYLFKKSGAQLNQEFKLVLPYSTTEDFLIIEDQILYLNGITSKKVVLAITVQNEPGTIHESTIFELHRIKKSKI